MKLGEIIKTYRFEHKLSLREFAHQCGVSFAQVRLMERGLNSQGNEFVPTVKSLKAVAKGMGLSLTALLENCDDMTIEWEEDDVAIAPEKQALIDKILIATPEQLEKIQSIINLVMP